MATFTKKKLILVIFGKFKKRNPHAVVFFRRILDRNVVVFPAIFISVSLSLANLALLDGR